MRLSSLIFSTIFVIGMAMHAKASILIAPQVLEQANSGKISVISEDAFVPIGSFGDAPLQFFEDDITIDYATPIHRAAFLELLLRNQIKDLKTEPHYPIADIDSQNPYYRYLQAALHLGIIGLDTNMKASPFTPLSRIEAAQIILRLRGPQNIQKAKQFTDITRTSPIYALSQALSEAGYMNGYSDGSFRPNTLLSWDHAHHLVNNTLQTSYVFTPHKVAGFSALFAPKKEQQNEYEQLRITANGETVTSQVYLKQRWFPHYRLQVPASSFKAYSSPSYDEGWERIYDAMETQGSREQLWQGRFNRPSKGRQTSNFGDKRTINGQYMGMHFGIDYAAPVGSSVTASNTGKVIFADHLEAFGNTLIVSHGQNVYSMYIHLNAIDVSVGQMVQKGAHIAELGNTGISSGPHLHFAMLIGKRAIDPHQWLQ